MSGILPRVRQPKEFADPGFTFIPSISAQCTLPSLASLFWLLYEIELSFRQEFGSKVFTGGSKFVTSMVTDLVRRAKICNECQYAVHMHFLGQAFPTEKSQILSVFDLKKLSALKNIQNFKIWKNPTAKTAKFKNLQNPALGVHYSGCSVEPSVTG